MDSCMLVLQAGVEPADSRDIVSTIFRERRRTGIFSRIRERYEIKREENFRELRERI